MHFSRDTFIPLCHGESSISWIHTSCLLTLLIRRHWSRCWSRRRWLSIWWILWRQVSFILYLTFLKLKCSSYNFYPFRALVPYGVGTGTGPGTGAATLPGAKPLKPPGMYLHPCMSALNKPLHPKFIQSMIFFLKKLHIYVWHVFFKAVWFCCSGRSRGRGRNPSGSRRLSRLDYKHFI